MKRTVTLDELKRLKAGGTAVRVVERRVGAAVVETPPEAPSRPPDPVEVRVVDPDTLERLIREERTTREALVDALEREPGPRRWRFTVTERDRDGFIKAIEAEAVGT